MAVKTKRKWSKVVVSLLLLIPTLFSFLGNVVNLVEYEAKLAKQSVCLLFVLALCALTLLSSTWLVLLVMLFVYLTSLQISSLTACFFIFLLNIFLLIMISLVMLLLKKNFSFPQTRHLLQQTLHLSKKE